MIILCFRVFQISKQFQTNRYLSSTQRIWINDNNPASYFVWALPQRSAPLYPISISVTPIARSAESLMDLIQGQTLQRLLRINSTPCASKMRQ